MPESENMINDKTVDESFQLPETNDHQHPVDKETPSQKNATLHILLRGGTVIERDLDKDEIKLGKGAHNDIILPDATVSSTHAMISYAEDAYTLTDLGSRNGTSLNDAQLTAPKVLSHGDLIKIGHCTITFRSADGDITLSIARSQLLGGGLPSPPPPPPAPDHLPANEESLAYVLRKNGLMIQDDLDRLTADKNKNLVKAILEEKLINDTELRDLMSRSFNIPPVDLRTMDVAYKVIRTLPQQFWRKKMICPVTGPSPDKAMLAVVDPLDKESIEQIEKETGQGGGIRLTTQGEVAYKLDEYFTPRLVGVTTSGDKIDFPINRPDIEIGKASHNKLVLSDPSISNTHAVILTRDGNYGIVDLGSSNGTFVNEIQLGKEIQILKHGDKIQIGRALMTFRNPAESTEDKTARLSPEALEEIRKRSASYASTSDAGIMSENKSATDVKPTPNNKNNKDQISEEDKKKKKDDTRIGAAVVNSIGRIAAAIASAVLTVYIAMYVVNRTSQPANVNRPASDSVKKDVKTVAINLNPTWQSLSGRFFRSKLEASGAASMPDSNGLVFVANNKPGEALFVQFDQNGNKTGEIKSIPLGVNFTNPEAMTYGSGFFYVVGSQTDTGDKSSRSLLRFVLDPKTQTLSGRVDVIDDLLTFITSKYPDLVSFASRNPQMGGITVKGLAWDPNNARFLVGLRFTLIGERAILLPLKFRDPRGQFNISNLIEDKPNILTLPLGGQGIRDVVYDTNLREFLILSGPVENTSTADFGLWQWSGKSDPVKLQSLAAAEKPEGITFVSSNGQHFIIVVGEAGNYLKLNYVE